LKPYKECLGLASREENGKMNKSKSLTQTLTPEIDKIIERAVQKSIVAIEKKDDEKDARTFDYYKATEKILYNYPKLIDIVADEYAYMEGIFKQRSKSITRFSPNAGYTDPSEEKGKERQKSYNRTKAQLESIDRILNQFRTDSRFKIIEMYYFNRDANGERRNDDSKQLSFEQIAEQIIKEDGNHPEVKTVRRWRSQIVGDISVALFGISAALSNSLTRRKPQGKMSE